MANEVGSASNLEDLFTKLISFVSTNAALVAAGQAWQVLKIRRDNLASLTTNLADPSGDANYRKAFHTCRYDSRSLNINDPAGNKRANFQATNFAPGVSHVTWQLRTARTVTSLRLQAPQYTTDLQYMVRNFRLQYSDNGTSWTTALTVASAGTYTVGEIRTFAVPASGSHLYWRMLIDSSNNGSTSTIAWSTMMLLEADGTVANHFGSEAILKGVGTAGTDEIFVGVRSEYDTAAGWFNLFMNGYTGFDPNEQSWFNQPGALPGYGAPQAYSVPMVPCWDTTMPYWFVASGRAFRFCVKVSTSYEGGYAGFILPYATPQQYPYPLAVGGSLVPTADARSAEWRYSYANWRHGVYPGPGADGASTSDVTGISYSTTLYLRLPDGSWGGFANRPQQSSYSPEGLYGPNVASTMPYGATGRQRCVWPHAMNDQWSTGKRPYRDCLGGGYMIQPCIILQRYPTTAAFGELEGTYSISGYQNAAENTTVYNGKTHVIFQNAYRNTVHEFWALSLD